MILRLINKENKSRSQLNHAVGHAENKEPETCNKIVEKFSKSNFNDGFRIVSQKYPLIFGVWMKKTENISKRESKKRTNKRRLRKRWKRDGE